MKLLVYTIGGQQIGFDILTWNEAMLSGNTAFMAIADTGSTPTNYVDVSSMVNWDRFGSLTTLTDAEIKNEIIKLIPADPTSEQITILEDWGIYIDTTFLSGETGTFWGDFRVEGKLWVETIRRVKQEANQAIIRVDQDSALGGGTIAGMQILNPTGATTGYTSIDDIPYYIVGVDKDGVLVAGWSGDTQPVMRGSSSITTLSTTDGGAATTTSPTPVLMTGAQLNSVPAGDYFLSFGTSLSHSSNGSNIVTTIYVGGSPVANSTQVWTRGTAQGNINTTHTYAGFPITVTTTGNVEIYWQTDSATATSTNRYISLIKV